jgi:hypothetical protein
LKVIQDSRPDAIVLWTDMPPAGMILKQMRELGMKQRVFGSHRTVGDELIQVAGPAAEGFEAVFPYDPSNTAPEWIAFQQRFSARYNETPDHFAALAYDAMQILLKSICRAGLNKGRIRDALTGLETYSGVTGDMVFDPNCKNIRPLYLATVHDGKISYRLATMNKESATARSGTGLLPNSSELDPSISIPYAIVVEDGVAYAGPRLDGKRDQSPKIAVFGRDAGRIVQGLTAQSDVYGGNSPHDSALTLIPIPSEASWGKASTMLVDAVYEEKVVAILALDRAASHLAEQIAVKSFVPVIAISDDTTLTSTNIPWIFRVPASTLPGDALGVLKEAIRFSPRDRYGLRDALALGKRFGDSSFTQTGEPQ